VRKQVTAIRQEQSVRWAGTALLALLGVGAFWDGLYGGGEQLAAAAALAVLVLRLRPAIVLSRMELAALALLGAGTGLALLHPAAAGNAAHGPLIVIGWFLALAVGRQFAGTDHLERMAGRILAATGFLMLFASLGALSYLPPHQSGRLAGFLGYPIAMGVLGMLGLAGSLPGVAEGRWWAGAVACANGTAVLLSGSRGLWAVGILLVAYLAWARPALLRRTLWPALGALAAALWAGPAVPLRHPVPALAAASLACLTVAAVQWFEYLPKESRKVAWTWAVAGAAAAACLAAVALAPGWSWLLGRATALPGTEGSSVERFTFIRDGLAIARGLPLGAGFRAWVALQLQRASYAYYSQEVHSAPLDLALSFGWAGAAGFLLLLGRFLTGLRQGRHWGAERVALLGALGALGLHALVDWDLSYGLFSVALWLGFGLVEAGASEGPGRDGPLPGGPGGRVLGLPAWLLTAVASLALAGVVVLGAGDVGELLASRALDAGQPFAARQHASLVITINPWNDMAWADLGRADAAFDRHDAALAALARARALNPYEPWYAELAAAEATQAGHWRDAAAIYREYVRLWPWETAAYEEALDRLMDLTFRAEIMGDHALAADLADAGREILAAMDRQKAREPAHTPRKPMAVDTPTLERARSYFEP
jgi:tetratricopeptide (TPR) repeat protein